MSFTQLTDAIVLAASLPTYYAASATIEIRTAVLRGYLVGVRAVERCPSCHGTGFDYTGPQGQPHFYESGTNCPVCCA